MRSSISTSDEANIAGGANGFDQLYPSPAQFDIAALLRGSPPPPGVSPDFSSLAECKFSMHVSFHFSPLPEKDKDESDAISR